MTAYIEANVEFGMACEELRSIGEFPSLNKNNYQYAAVYSEPSGYGDTRYTEPNK